MEKRIKKLIENVNSSEDESEEDSSESGDDSAMVDSKGKKWVNRQRTLLICSRGVSHQHRHLVNDLYSLLPHSKKEPKIEKKDVSLQVSELALIRSCNHAMYFESRKGKYLYLTLSRCPKGPSAKFQVQNSNTC